MAVSKSPSVLGSIEVDKAENVAKLSGVPWASPKVLLFILSMFESCSIHKKHLFFHSYCICIFIHRRLDLKYSLAISYLKCFNNKNMYRSGRGGRPTIKSMEFAL